MAGDRGDSVDTVEIRKAIQAAEKALLRVRNPEVAMPHIISALNGIVEMLDQLRAQRGKMAGK